MADRCSHNASLSGHYYERREKNSSKQQQQQCLNLGDDGVVMAERKQSMFRSVRDYSIMVAQGK